MNTGKTSRRRHMLRPRKCFQRLLEGKDLHIMFHLDLVKADKLPSCYLLRDAPRARITGSVISIIDCRVEVTTMKRMMLRRKVRCSACMSSRPVWRARRSRVTPSVTPLTTRTRQEVESNTVTLAFYQCQFNFVQDNMRKYTTKAASCEFMNPNTERMTVDICGD